MILISLTTISDWGQKTTNQSFQTSSPKSLSVENYSYTRNTEEGKCRLTNEYLFFLFLLAVGIMKKILCLFKNDLF